MNIKRGILAYILLALSSTMLDVGMLWILGTPLFLYSTVLLLSFYFSLVDNDKRKRLWAMSFILMGTLLLSAIIAYAVLKYTSFLRAESHSLPEEPFSSLILSWVQIGSINLLAVLLILSGLGLGVRSRGFRPFGMGAIGLFLLPIAVLLIKIFQLQKIGI